MTQLLRQPENTRATSYGYPDPPVPPIHFGVSASRFLFFFLITRPPVFLQTLGLRSIMYVHILIVDIFRAHRFVMCLDFQNIKKNNNNKFHVSLQDKLICMFHH